MRNKLIKFVIKFSDNLAGVNHGTASASSDPNFYNSFPLTNPRINATGIYAQEVDVLNLMPYAIDIYQEFQMHERPKYPIYTFLNGIGGETIYVDDILYTDCYEGNDTLDVPLDNIALRDIWGNGTSASASNMPLSIGSSGEIGGMVFFQKAFIGDKAMSSMSICNFDAIKDNDLIWVETPTTTWADPTLTGYQTLATTSLGNGARLNEAVFARNSSGTGKNLVIAYRRTRASTDKYSNVVGDPDDIIRKLENMLAIRKYVYTEYDCYVNGTSATEKVYSLKYVTNTSRRIMMPFDNMTLALQNGANVYYDDAIHVLVGIDQFIYNAARNMFIIIYNFEDSTITTDISASTATITGSGSIGSQLTASRYYVVTQGAPGAACVTLGDTHTHAGATVGIGQIFKSNTDQDGTHGDTIASGAKVALVSNSILLEEVNTAATSQRIFGSTYDGSTVKYIGGGTHIARCALINRHRDLATPKSPLGGFESKKRGFYNFHIEEKVQYVQIFRSDTWTVGVHRQNTKLKIDLKDIEKSRGWHVDEFKRDIQNTEIWGKKSKVRDENGEFVRGMSGILDKELNNQTKYIYRPIPTSSGVIDPAQYKSFIENLAYSLHYNRTPGDYSDETAIFCGLKVLELLGNANAYAGTATGTNNPFGFSFESVPPSDELTFGLPVYKLKTIYGKLNFMYAPELDFETGFEVPYFLFPNHGGKLDPRYLVIALNPASIKFYTRAGYEEKIYGNLQPNNNPNIYTEGIQAGHSVVFRNSRDNTILYMPPRA